MSPLLLDAPPARDLAPTPLSCADAALVQVGHLLQRSGYHFTCVTPGTHAVVLARAGAASATDLRGIFGWNLPFTPAQVPAELFSAMEAADVLVALPDGRLRSRVRFATLGRLVVLHAGYPTSQPDAVFFGPDTYRFVHLLRRTLTGGAHLLEIGAGSGAAALALADRFARVVMTDINPEAVRFARINATLAGCRHALVHRCDLVAGAGDGYDAVIANPPYVIDPAHRLYRDGGQLGIEVALAMVQAGLPLLAPGGRFVLYTGAPIVDGCDRLAEALLPRLEGYRVSYEELDVDVFGEELAEPVYRDACVERLAVVAVVVQAKQPDSAQADRYAGTWGWP